jgi:hypothetical protein
MKSKRFLLTSEVLVEISRGVKDISEKSVRDPPLKGGPRSVGIGAQTSTSCDVFSTAPLHDQTDASVIQRGDDRKEYEPYGM